MAFWMTRDALGTVVWRNKPAWSDRKRLWFTPLNSKAELVADIRPGAPVGVRVPKNGIAKVRIVEDKR